MDKITEKVLDKSRSNKENKGHEVYSNIDMGKEYSKHAIFSTGGKKSFGLAF
jgi:hypothetical protein